MARPKVRLISFNDIKPPHSILCECSGGIGIDHNQNIYLCASDFSCPNDVLMFRYNTKSEARELLGTLRGISLAEGNLGPNQYWHYEESFAKVHVSILEHDGKMYFASHDFRDFGISFRNIHKRMKKRRGAHFYSFDLKRQIFEDLSKTDDFGVSIRHQGVIAMDILREQKKLVGLTFPFGDILIYDFDKKKTRCYTGVAIYRDDHDVNVTRQIMATRKGKIYFSYATDDFWLWELDPESAIMKRTKQPNILKNGYIVGKVVTKDQNTIYLLDLTGNLYAFGVEKERLQLLGALLPDEEIKQARQTPRINGMALSHDEKKLYAMPSRLGVESVFKERSMRFLTSISPRTKRAISWTRMKILHRAFSLGKEIKSASCALYEYDIETGKKARIAKFPSILEGGWITGNGVTDNEGRIYFGYHNLLKDSVRIIQISGIKT